MSVHHCRVVHASALNRSARPRRVLYYEFNAADAWPILGLSQHYSDDPAVAYEVYNSRIVAGMHGRSIPERSGMGLAIVGWNEGCSDVRQPLSGPQIGFAIDSANAAPSSRRSAWSR